MSNLQNQMGLSDEALASYLRQAKENELEIVRLSPDDVCVRYQRQYGKALTTAKLKEWSRDGNFPLPRSINGVIGWESNVVTNGLNELSKAAGRGYTSITRGFAR